MFPHGSAGLHILGFSLELLSLIVEPPTSGESQRHFGVSPPEVHFERDERESFLLGLARQASDLLTVKKKLANSFRIHIGPVRLLVRRNVKAVEPHLSLLYSRESIVEGELAGAERLHLGPLEDHPRFIGIEDFVLVTGLPIPANDVTAAILVHETETHVTFAPRSFRMARTWAISPLKRNTIDT